MILPEIPTELYRIVAELGGTINGEHGIGHKRKRCKQFRLNFLLF